MSDKPTFTARDIELITFAFQCLKDPNGLQVDYKKLADVATFKTPASAATSWGIVKKKLLSAAGPPAGGSSAADGDDAAGPASANATPTEPKGPPKKRAQAKPKAKAAVEPEEAEGENGVAADDEQTPTNTPKKKGSAKRKAPEPSSLIKAEGDVNTTENAAAHGEDAATDGTPAKKKRVYNRKPKDPNAPTPKPRAKKGAKAVTTAAATEDNTDAANAQLLDDAEGEFDAEGHVSIFGDGNIKVEGPDELTAEERYMAEKAMDEQTFNVVNGAV